MSPKCHKGPLGVKRMYIYVPLEAADCPRIVEDCRAGRDVLPEKQLRRRPKAEDYWKRP